MIPEGSEKKLNDFEKELIAQADGIAILAGQLAVLIANVQTVLALQKKMMVESGFEKKSIDDFCDVRWKAFYVASDAQLAKELKTVGLTLRKLGEPPTPPDVLPLN